MNLFNRIILQLAFIISFLFSRVFAQSFREYTGSFISFNSISQQLVLFFTFICFSSLFLLSLQLFPVRLREILSGFSLKFLALSITNFLLYCITTPPTSGVYIITAPFFFFIGIIFWHRKILQDTTVSIIIAMLFNFSISILQNPIFSVNNQLFVQQSYYGRSAGLIGINQNGAFIAIFLSFLIFTLSTNIFYCDIPLKFNKFNIRLIYPYLLFFGVLALFFTISRVSLIFFFSVLAFKYLRLPRVAVISRKSMFWFLIFLGFLLYSSIFLSNNFPYLFHRLSRIDYILLNSDNLRYVQFSRFIDAIFLEAPSNMLGLLPSSLYINTFGDNMWMESIIAYGMFYTISLFGLYVYSFVILRRIASRSLSFDLVLLRSMSFALSYVSVGIVLLSSFYGGIQSIPISSTYFLLVGLVYSESRYTLNNQINHND